MPIYEYRCGACGEDFERYLPTSATPVACPSCASPQVNRKLSLITFKGAGAVASAVAPAGSCCGGGCSCH